MADILENKKVHVVKFRWVWMALSACLLLPGICAMIYSTMHYDTHTPLKVGIDYTGGSILQYGVKNKVANSDITRVRVDLKKNGVEDPYIQILNVEPTKENNEISSIISIRTKFIGESKDAASNITNSVQEQFNNAQLIQVSSVGPTLGKELFKNSLIALTLAILAIIAYLSFRFRFDYAISAILGLVHDTIFVIGAFSL